MKPHNYLVPSLMRMPNSKKITSFLNSYIYKEMGNDVIDIYGRFRDRGYLRRVILGEAIAVPEETVLVIQKITSFLNSLYI